jgi:hypothetical protein
MTRDNNDIIHRNAPTDSSIVYEKWHVLVKEQFSFRKISEG